MKVIAKTLIIIFISFTSIYSQNSTIKGQIIEKGSNEALFGVNIVLEDKSGGTTDDKGNFNIKTKAGRHILSFHYIGYKTEKRTIYLHDGETLELLIILEPETQLISETVISAGRHEQKISEVVVSMEVIKASMLENTNTIDMDKAINQIPGVDIIDEQPTIRGGSGYSYGAGSRVMVLVDDLPILSPDAGDPKWHFLPVENVSQIEIIKGASSVLYGSSALNGVINVRTAYPEEKPKTKISIFNGLYMNPSRKELIWWGNYQPLFAGANVFHSQQLNNKDLTVGGHIYSTDGYREYEQEERGRINVNYRVRNRKISGLSYGINTNMMAFEKNDFFIWLNADSGAYRQDPDAITHMVGSRLNIDPYIIYFDKNENKHSLKTRYLAFNNKFPGDSVKNSTSSMTLADYQYQKQIQKNRVITLGITSSYGEVQSYLFGNHFSTNLSLYSQIDWKITNKLNLSGGVRGEYFRIDKEETITVIQGDTINIIPIQPVLRFGANYQLAKFTFLRASYGEGYRFPSIGEKYVSANISLLNIFPNHNLKPETGWSSEIGIKQGFKLSGWNGYVDIAGFWQEYKDMMEFTFGFYNPETYKPINIQNPSPEDLEAINNVTDIKEIIGFQSINVGRAKITGIDFTVTGIGKLFEIPATLLAGFTIINPIDLNNDSTKTSDNKYLKYRSLYTAKADLELNYKKWSWGASMIYRSRMINIDSAFEEPLLGPLSTVYILPGLKEYREKHNKGNFVFDIRAGYSVTDFSKFSLILKNALNKEYMGRPGDIAPPRSLSLQYSLNF